MNLEPINQLAEKMKKERWELQKFFVNAGDSKGLTLARNVKYDVDEQALSGKRKTM